MKGSPWGEPFVWHIENLIEEIFLHLANLYCLGYNKENSQESVTL